MLGGQEISALRIYSVRLIERQNFDFRTKIKRFNFLLKIFCKTLCICNLAIFSGGSSVMLID